MLDRFGLARFGRRGLAGLLLVGIAACASREQWKGAQRASAPAQPSVDSLQAELPVLRVGDKWRYQYTGHRGSGTFTQRIRGRQTVDGIECYVVAPTETRQEFLRVTDMALVETREHGATIIRHRPPLELFRWPLRVGSSWRQALVVERPKDESTMDMTSECKVVAEEALTVPAGTFGTLKIECRNGRGQTIEQWFAPEVRNVVRTRRPEREGLQTRDLIAYQLTP